eukprot:TRINITY_DN168_c0_g1_i2.p1 TRINITY_DN168_c0_g1~~TRINITY_DN168_c0_g1_i2.p1  ORF type:complete len:109 (+),score=26.60 TRINITY_DN168_c0_g1_i2:1827-2153(+)
MLVFRAVDLESLDFGFKTPEIERSGCWIQDVGCLFFEVLDFTFKHSRCKIQDGGLFVFQRRGLKALCSGLKRLERQFQDTARWIQDAMDSDSREMYSIRCNWIRFTRC